MWRPQREMGTTSSSSNHSNLSDTVRLSPWKDFKVYGRTFEKSFTIKIENFFFANIDKYRSIFGIHNSYDPNLIAK